VSEAEAGAEFETVGEFREVFEAELAALRLREAGLEVYVLDQSFRQEPLPNVRSFAIVRVMVPRASVDEARRLLAQTVPVPEDAEDEEGPEPSS
jgi:hypothetical protein